MKHVLKYGLMAVMLGGFAGQAAAAAGAKAEFSAKTGCWAVEAKANTTYTIETIRPMTFLFIKLGKTMVTQADAAKVTLTKASGGALKVDNYDPTAYDVLYSRVQQTGDYTLNVGAAMPVMVCWNMENSFIDPAVKLPNEATLPTFGEVRNADGMAKDHGPSSKGYVVPAAVRLDVPDNGCTSYQGKATVFEFSIVRPNRYLFVSSSGGTRPEDDENREAWDMRTPVLMMDDRQRETGVIELSEYDEGFGFVRLRQAADYMLTFDLEQYNDRLGDLIVCQSRAHERPDL